MKHKLKDIFDLQMGKTPSRNKTEYWIARDYKWISIADLTRTTKYISETKEYLSESAVEESGIKIIPANTVVMSFKLSIGKVAITSEDMYSNEAIMAFHDKHIVEILPEYIFYMFKYKNWDEGSNKAVMGKTLNKASLSEIEVNICPIEKQKKIIQVLDKLADIISGREQELKLLDELIKARFVEMFGDPIINERKWLTKQLGEVCTKITDGEHQNPLFTESGIPMVMANNIRTFVVFESCKYISKNDYEKFSRKCKPEKGDILLVSRGATIGRCCINDSDIPFALMGSVILIKNNPQYVLSEFLCNWLQNEAITKEIYTTSSASAQQAIYMKDLNKKLIYIPPLRVQEKFSEFVNQVNKSKVAVQKTLDEAQTLFDSLMQEYFG